MRGKLGHRMTLLAAGAVAVGLLGVWLLPHCSVSGQEVAAAKVYLRDDFEGGKLDGWGWINNPQDPCHSEGEIETTQQDAASGKHAVKFIDVDSTHYFDDIEVSNRRDA